ncbi:Twin transmembrane helix small protein [Priestia megaterium]|uniref:hypothetical protein n=1 Tax=Priestia megaterium TaxID=1404 RepID=UPI00114405E0|nr:hypothetical protein [Priestia megaterium]MED3869443.1 hypothetical protein [Priestia megaterium]
MTISVQLTLIILTLALSVGCVLFVMNIFKVGFVEVTSSSNTLSKVSISLMGAYLLMLFTAFFCMINNL